MPDFNPLTITWDNRRGRVSRRRALLIFALNTATFAAGAVAGLVLLAVVLGLALRIGI